MLADGIDHVYISDNSPSDDLRPFCEKLSKVEYFFNGKNLGYGGGHNVAIKKAIAEGSDYHLVINADVYFNQGVIPAITKYMSENEDVAMVQPNVLYPNGEQQYTVRMLPTPANLIFRRFFPKSWGEKMNYKYLLKFNDHKRDKHCAASYKSHKMLLIHMKNMIKYFNKWGWIFDEERKKWNEEILEKYS